MLKSWGHHIVELLEAYGVKLRPRHPKVQITLSFPRSDPDSMAIGMRYQKPEGIFTEDLFVFEKDVGPRCYYTGAQQKVLSEYAGSHRFQPVLTGFTKPFRPAQTM